MTFLQVLTKKNKALKGYIKIQKVTENLNLTCENT